MTESLLCPPADFALDDRGNARAPTFGDVYFSAEGGLDETKAVFLTGTGLPHRWRGRPRFTVAELGFGTGLNVLALLDLWRQHRPSGGRLDIVTVESHPLTRDQARAALTRWPALTELTHSLLQMWPPPWRGAHRRRFDSLHATLTVLHEEATTALAEADFMADAWFLDGFAPARNPDMWSSALLAQVARLSAPDARAATFTVAGIVRRGLAEVGFRVEKRTGFGRKRERLEAVFTGPAALAPEPISVLARARPRPGSVAIVGGGVAGASLAHALRARGRDVKIIADRGLAAGASGSPTGLLTPRLEGTASPHVRATMAAFAFSRALFEGWEGFYPEGALRFAPTVRKIERLRRTAGMLGPDFELMDARRATERTGAPDPPDGIFIHPGGRFEPGKLVRRLAHDTPVIDARIERLERTDETWRLLDGDGQTVVEVATVILAGGAAMAGLAGSVGISLAPRPGRIVLLQDSPDAPLRTPIAWGRYVAPVGDRVLLGATHEQPGQLRSADETCTDLRAHLRNVMPAFEARLGPMVADWSGVRAATKDRLPLAGPLSDGLIVLSGFGGRGFAHAPLLAEMIAGDLDGAPAALERTAIATLHPARFEARTGETSRSRDRGSELP